MQSRSIQARNTTYRPQPPVIWVRSGYGVAGGPDTGYPGNADRGIPAFRNPE